MEYRIKFKPKAFKDLQRISPQTQKRIVNKIEQMSDDLKGDVKQLTDFTPEYRLRVGDYRVLFEVEGDIVTVYRVRHRRDVYR